MNFTHSLFTSGLTLPEEIVKLSTTCSLSPCRYIKFSTWDSRHIYPLDVYDCRHNAEYIQLHMFTMMIINLSFPFEIMWKANETTNNKYLEQCYHYILKKYILWKYSFNPLIPLQIVKEKNFFQYVLKFPDHKKRYGESWTPPLQL